MIEARGLGIRRVAFEPVAMVGLVVDLGAADAGRMPDTSAREAEIEGIRLPRIPELRRGSTPARWCLQSSPPTPCVNRFAALHYY